MTINTISDFVISDLKISFDVALKQITKSYITKSEIKIFW